MDAEVLGTMRTARPVIKESGRVEDVHHLRLMALLHELVREKGNRGVAAALGIDPRTLWRCRATGNLTSRLSAALERLMLTRDLSAAMRQGEWRLAQFEERMCG